MAQTLTFDTLAYAKKLVAVGVPQQQAEVQAEALVDIIYEHIATKENVKNMESTLYTELKDMEMWLTVRFGIMIAASTAITVVLIKLI